MGLPLSFGGGCPPLDLEEDQFPYYRWVLQMMCCHHRIVVVVTGWLWW